MNFKQATDYFVAEKLKDTLYNKMWNEFSDLIHNDDETEKIQLMFNIPGKEGTFHVFQFPNQLDKFLTKEGAYKILDELERFDNRLSTHAQFMWYTEPK